MIAAEMTQQEKKDLAVAYGFLVDVWKAQQLKIDLSKVSTRYANANDRVKNHYK